MFFSYLCVIKTHGRKFIANVIYNFYFSRKTVWYTSFSCDVMSSVESVSVRNKRLVRRDWRNSHSLCKVYQLRHTTDQDTRHSVSVWNTQCVSSLLQTKKEAHCDARQNRTHAANTQHLLNHHLWSQSVACMRCVCHTWTVKSVDVTHRQSETKNKVRRQERWEKEFHQRMDGIRLNRAHIQRNLNERKRWMLTHRWENEWYSLFQWVSFRFIFRFTHCITHWLNWYYG